MADEKLNPVYDYLKSSGAVLVARHPDNKALGCYVQDRHEIHIGLHPGDRVYPSVLLHETAHSTGRAWDGWGLRRSLVRYNTCIDARYFEELLCNHATLILCGVLDLEVGFIADNVTAEEKFFLEKHGSSGAMFCDFARDFAARVAKKILKGRDDDLEVASGRVKPVPRNRSLARMICDVAMDYDALVKHSILADLMLSCSKTSIATPREEGSIRLSRRREVFHDGSSVEIDLERCTVVCCEK